MLEEIDLRQLAEMRGPERAFLSFYAAGEPGINGLDDRAKRIRAMLCGVPDELEHFERSLALLRAALPSDGANGGMAIFSCWALDYCVCFPLSVPPRRDLLRVEAAPYIRPLAELKDEYEPFLVLTADNRQSRIYQVIAARPTEEERVRGDVKNHVKKGGWSQKRYQRRRRNELLHYAKDVVEQLESLSSEKTFDHARIVLLGQPEALGEIKGAMPPALAERIAGERNVALGGDEDTMLGAAFELYAEQERRDEAALWDRIRGEYLADGLAATGARDVLAAALEGRVETMIVTRDAEVNGMRCRDCELVAVAQPQQCPRCRSTSVFEVDLIEELVHQLEKTGADVEFCDPLAGLTELGDLAALLRW